MKDLIVIALIAILVWFGSIIVEKENYQYAAMIGMCNEHIDPIIKHECLLKKETRTHWIWHLAYALRIL